MLKVIQHFVKHCHLQGEWVLGMFRSLGQAECGLLHVIGGYPSSDTRMVEEKKGIMKSFF
jgi:hypothetical protein